MNIKYKQMKNKWWTFLNKLTNEDDVNFLIDNFNGDKKIGIYKYKFCKIF